MQIDLNVSEDTISLVDRLVEEGRVTDPRTPKGRLLAKAAKLFKAHGYERTTVRDLAAEVGIQSGSIFHHFKTKEDILRALMEEVVVYTTERMHWCLERAPTPRDKLKALIICELEAINGMTGNAMSLLVHEWRSLNKDNQGHILKLRDSYETLWLSVLEEAKAQHLIKVDPFILRRLLTGAISWTTNWFDPNKKMSLDELAEHIIALTLD